MLGLKQQNVVIELNPIHVHQFQPTYKSVKVSSLSVDPVASTLKKVFYLPVSGVTVKKPPAWFYYHPRFLPGSFFMSTY